MLKLKDVYANNPALGDPNMLEKKVEENAQKLDAIRQELHKFEVIENLRACASTTPSSFAVAW